MKMKNTMLSLLLMITLLPVQLYAGLTVTTISKSNGCNDHSSNGKTIMYMRADILRIDMEDQERKTGIIYQKSEGKMWVIDYLDKSYHTITRHDFELMQEQFSQVQKMMEEQMKNLPEDQREQMKKMMGEKSLFLKEKPEMAYIKTSDKSKVNNWNTVKYNYTENKILKTVYWVAEKDELSVDAMDLQIIRDFSNFISENFNMFSFGASTAAFSPDQSFDGFPVKTIHMEKEKECIVSTVESIVEGSLENSLFEIPKGFSKKENPMKGN
jgi:hypothetical protein